MLKSLIEMVNGEIVSAVHNVNDSVKIAYSVPDNTSRPGVKSGSMFSRNKPTKCPQCGDIFYFWGDTGKIYTTVTVQPLPMPDGNGWIMSRATCGSNACWVNESDYTVKVSPSWIKATTGVSITPNNNNRTNRTSRLIEVRDE